MEAWNQDFETFVAIANAGVMSNLPVGPVVCPEPEPNVTMHTRSAASKGVEPGAVGTYTTTIKWGIRQVRARPAGPGFWGERTPQAGRVDAYELKINPRNESYYLRHPKGGFVQFENATRNVVQDGKLVLDKGGSSFYRDFDKLPPFARKAIIDESKRQVEAASAAGLNVEWKISDPVAAQKLQGLFSQENVNVMITHLPE